MREHPIVLAIAGQPIAFHLRSCRLKRDLRRRYRGYVARGTTPVLALHCEVSAKGFAGGENVDVRIHGSGAGRARRRDFDAQWRGRRGSVRLYPSLYAFDALLRVVLATRCLLDNRILVHASAAVFGQKGFVFAGPSGSGKTTVARLCAKGTVLSDEIVCLRVIGANRAAVYATPFWGEMGSGPATTRSFALGGLFFLRKSRRVTRVRPCSKQKALRNLLRCTCLFGNDSALAAKALAIASRVVAASAVGELHFEKRADIARAISKQKVKSPGVGQL